MKITDKDIQTFRERAKTELQSNGAVGRIAWDSVVDALCNEVEELRKNAAISNAVDSAWADVCAACAKGMPPVCCAYYGEPNGCNAPTLGKHPEGDLAERLQEALEKAERRIAELKRATGNAAAITRAQLQTIADLVAIAHDEYDGCPSYCDDLERFDRLLTEIKAEVQSSPGNAAAMREALMKAKLYFDHRGEGTNLDDAGMAIDAIISIDAALVTPARNCDRFQSNDRLTDAVSALNAYANEEEHEPVRRWNESDWRRFLDWIFATAKKGGAE